ncbi:Nuclear fragile X mental retardation-interacting protein 1 [Camponotus japonicus]
MSPLNRGSPLGSRQLPAGARPLPPPRFGGRPAIPQRIPPLPPRLPSPPRMRRIPPPINPMFGPGDPRQRIPPLPLPSPQPLRPVAGGGMSRLSGRDMPPLFPGGPRARHLAPIVPPMGPRGPLMRPWPRRMMPPQMMPPMRPMRYNAGNGSLKSKPSRNAKKLNNRTDHPADEETQNEDDENCIGSDDEKSHYCEVCDRDFPSKDTLSQHKSTHRVCSIDGCTFSAHPMLVEKHITMQHRTGLYERMKDLSIPENLEKWIMERKKRYPTEANINLRKAEELEKIERGEIIQQNSNVQTRMKKTVNVRQKKRRPRKRYTCENSNYVHKDELYRGLHPFPGTNVLQEEDNKICLDKEVDLDEQTDLCEKIAGNISDEDDVPQISATLESTNSPVVNLKSTLPILVADYESESNDEGPEEVPVKRMKIEELQDKIIENTVHEKISDLQKCKNENDKLNDKSQKTSAKDKQKQEMNRNNVKNNNFLHPYHYKLLEKLLSRSIQHERNLICQCVKYIIENNFFD